MEIEEAASQLIAFGGKPSLTKSEHAEVKKIMGSLKKAGLSNAEISKLCKDRWSESTIKGYVKGIRSAAQSPWQDAIGLLESVINAGLTLDEVETTVAVHKNLESTDVDLGEVVEFLESAKSSSLDVETLIKQYEAFKASGLSIKEVRGILNLKQNLEQIGLGLGSLGTLLELAEQYGEPHKIIEAISEYGSLAELKEEKIAANRELESAKQDLTSAQKQLQDVKAQIGQSTAPLQAFKKANELGFGQAELLKLSALAKKHSTVQKVIAAVEAYGEYSDITESTNKAKTELSSILDRISKMEADHAHLKSAVTMCDTLLKQYKFGLDAIGTIVSVAQKYGEAIAVLKAVEAYGELLAIRHEQAKAEAKSREQKDLLAQLEAKHAAMLSELDSLTALCLKVGKDIGMLQSQIQSYKGLEKILNLINEPASCGYNEYGQQVAAMLSSIRKWLITHEQKFKYPLGAKSSLDGLLKELGGI